MASGDTETEAIEAAFAAGAAIYCVKTAEQEDSGLGHPPGVRAVDLHRERQRQPATSRRRSDRATVAHELTRRELEILRLVAEGHSNSQLARMLWVTEQTVKFHLSNIYRKLDVANRTEASRWAQLHGLLPAHREEDVDAAIAVA